MLFVANLSASSAVLPVSALPGVSAVLYIVSDQDIEKPLARMRNSCPCRHFRARARARNRNRNRTSDASQHAPAQEFTTRDPATRYLALPDPDP